ncbi:MAG: LysE family transporter [Bacteroidetes bacterium]|nr:LysE family transporter [Bacteroidota bacterium]
MLAYLTIFTTSFVIAFSGAMMPGPFMTMTIGESAKSGPWVGPKMIVGHAILEIGLLLALFFGLAPLFKKELFFIVIAIAGGAIMIWMAQSMFRSLPKLEIKTSATSENQVNLYLAGILMSLANPYWIIWWATIGMGYVLHSQKLGFTGIVFFFIGHILGDLVWYSTISFAVGKGRKFFSNKTYRILVGICAAFLSLFAGWLIFDGVVKLFAIN